MKKRIGAWLLTGLLSGGAASAADLYNGSFEKEGPAADRAQGWERWGQWINRETAWKPVKSGDCILAYHHYKIEAGDDSGVWQDVKDVKAGQRYTFTVLASLDPAESGASGPLAVELRLESTVQGQQLVVQSKTYPADELATGSQWSTLQVTGTAAADNLRVLLIVRPAPSPPRDGALKFDDAKLALVGVPLVRP